MLQGRTTKSMHFERQQRSRLPLVCCRHYVKQ